MSFSGEKLQKSKMEDQIREAFGGSNDREERMIEAQSTLCELGVRNAIDLLKSIDEEKGTTVVRAHLFMITCSQRDCKKKICKGDCEESSQGFFRVIVKKVERKVGYEKEYVSTKERNDIKIIDENTELAKAIKNTNIGGTESFGNNGCKAAIRIIDKQIPRRKRKSKEES